jgi:hypothetical protein
MADSLYDNDRSPKRKAREDEREGEDKMEMREDKDAADESAGMEATEADGDGGDAPMAKAEMVESEGISKILDGLKALTKAHESERRDMHGNHRESMRQMHGRHEKQIRELLDQHMKMGEEA